MVTDERRRMLLIWWHRFIFRADSAGRRPPAARRPPPAEGWVPLNDIPRLVGKGDIMSGTSMTALLYVLTEL